MKLLLNSMIVALAAALGLAAGHAWRGKSERNSRLTEVGVTPACTQSPSNQAPSVGKFAFLRVHDDSPLATQLEKDLSMSSGVTRWLYWLEGMEKAELSDFPRLARLAQGNATATRLLASRWVELDLRHLFDTLAAAQGGRGLPVDELAEVLFEEWPRRDPDAAIAALSGSNKFGAREEWRMNVAALLVDKDPERGLRALSEWRIDNFIPRMASVAKWAAANPRHAAEVTLAHPAGWASRVVMETIGKEWAQADPIRAMEFAASRSSELGSVLENRVLKQWASLRLQDAADWLAAADPPVRNRLGPVFVEAWAKKDPSGALAWCESNLAGDRLALAVGGVVKSTARSDVTRGAGLVTAMPPSFARAEAAAAVAQRWFPSALSGRPAPPAVLEWMTGLDARSTKRALEQVQWQWSISDPKGMAKFLATTASENVPASADVTLARNLARHSPAEALAWAGRLTAERGLAAGKEAFAEWLRSQPESAMNWVSGLPSTDPRRGPFLDNVVR